LIQTWNTGSETDVSFYYEFALEPGLKIQYQAFAENYIGTTKGQQVEYWIGGDPTLGKWWKSDSQLAGGWRESSWLGTYLPNLENDWVYHLLLGWMYVQHDEQGGVWLWVPDEKWLWTKEAVWPFLWSDSSEGWLYLIYSKGSHYLYDYSTESVRP